MDDNLSCGMSMLLDEGMSEHLVMESNVKLPSVASKFDIGLFFFLCLLSPTFPMVLNGDACVGNNCDYDAYNFFHAAKIHTFSHKGRIMIM